MIRLEVRKAGKSVARLMAGVDPTDPAALRRLLLDAIRRAGDEDDAAGWYELLVLDPHGAPVNAFVVA